MTNYPIPKIHTCTSTAPTSTYSPFDGSNTFSILLHSSGNPTNSPVAESVDTWMLCCTFVGLCSDTEQSIMVRKRNKRKRTNQTTTHFNS